MISEIKQKIINKIYENPFEEEVWDLDRSFLRWIIPRLKMFKYQTNSFPSDLTFKQWKGKITKMINCFESALNNDDEKKLQQGLNLFVKYLKYLWN